MYDFVEGVCGFQVIIRVETGAAGEGISPEIALNVAVRAHAGR